MAQQTDHLYLKVKSYGKQYVVVVKSKSSAGKMYWNYLSAGGLDKHSVKTESRRGCMQLCYLLSKYILNGPIIIVCRDGIVSTKRSSSPKYVCRIIKITIF